MKKSAIIIVALLLILLVSCDSNVVTPSADITVASETTVAQTMEDTSAETTSVAETTDHIHTLEDAYMASALAHYKSCTICGQIALQENHTYGDWIIIKEATEKEDGIKEKACSVCGYKQSEGPPQRSFLL